MVTIIGLEKKINAKTKEAYSVLVLQGNAEVLKSKVTGRPYVTAKKTTIPCALHDNLAKTLIGQTLPGSIERVECQEFELKLPNGKKVKISHSYQYSPDPVTIDEVIG